VDEYKPQLNSKIKKEVRMENKNLNETLIKWNGDYPSSTQDYLSEGLLILKLAGDISPHASSS
jgi:hypothetical protein